MAKLVNVAVAGNTEMTEMGTWVVQSSIHSCPLPAVAVCHGRDKELESVVREITRPQVHVCCVYGLPGVGKTMLVKAAAHQLNDYHEKSGQADWRATYVSLGDQESQDQCLRAILEGLGQDLVEGQEFTHLQQLMKDNDIRNHILVLDACDKAFRYQKVQFHSLLSELAKCFKVITTSLTRYESDGLEVSYLNLKPFDLKTARSVLLQLCNMGNNLKTNIADQLVKVCYCMAIGIRIIAAVLRSQQYTPKSLLLHLDGDDGDNASIYAKLDEFAAKEGSLLPQISACFEAAYKCLPQQLQQQLPPLSLFPGSFSDQACAFVLQMENKSSVLQEVLGPLQEYSFLSPGKNGHQYIIHNSVVTFLRAKFRELPLESQLYAKEKLCMYYMKRLKQASAQFLDNPKQSVLLFDRNRSNYELLLQGAVLTKLYGDYMDLVINSDGLFRVTLKVDQRCRLYEECTKAAKQQNDPPRLCAATLCWADSLLDASNPEDAKSCLDSISTYEDKLENKLLTIYRILEASVMTSQGEPQLATKHLMKSCLNQDSPSSCYPLLRARALVALGNASVAVDHKCAAIKQYQMAKDTFAEGLTKESQLSGVPTSVTRVVPIHPDICSVLLRIGHCQFQMRNYTASESTFIQALIMQSRLSCDRLSRAMTSYHVGISQASTVHTAEHLDQEKLQDAVENLGAAQEEAMRLSKSHPLNPLAALALGSLFFRKGLAMPKTKQKDTRTEFNDSLKHFKICAEHCEKLEDWRESTTAIDAIAHQAIISAVLKIKREEVIKLRDKCTDIVRHRQCSNEDILPIAVKYIMSPTFPDCCKSLGVLRVSFTQCSSSCCFSLCMTKRQSSVELHSQRKSRRRPPRSTSVPIPFVSKYTSQQAPQRCLLIDLTAPSPGGSPKETLLEQTKPLMQSSASPTLSEDNHHCSTSQASDKSGASCSPIKGPMSSYRQFTCRQDVVKAESTLAVPEEDLEMVLDSPRKDATGHCCIQ